MTALNPWHCRLYRRGGYHGGHRSPQQCSCTAQRSGGQSGCKEEVIGAVFEVSHESPGSLAGMHASMSTQSICHQHVLRLISYCDKYYIGIRGKMVKLMTDKCCAFLEVWGFLAGAGSVTKSPIWLVADADTVYMYWTAVDEKQASIVENSTSSHIQRLMPAIQGDCNWCRDLLAHHLLTSIQALLKYALPPWECAKGLSSGNVPVSCSGSKSPASSIHIRDAGTPEADPNPGGSVCLLLWQWTSWCQQAPQDWWNAAGHILGHFALFGH